MPTKKTTKPVAKINASDPKIPESLIDAMYKFIKKNPKYVMPINDIYALYDIATTQFGRSMERMIKELKKQQKLKK